MSELTSVLAEERIARYVTRRDVERFLRYVGRRATTVKVRSEFQIVKEDPKDSIVLNTAYCGRADYKMVAPEDSGLRTNLYRTLF